jgi:hypothetical protein
LKTLNTSQYNPAPATTSIAQRITLTQNSASTTGNSKRN